ERNWIYRRKRRAKLFLHRAKKVCKKMGVECDLTEEWIQTRLDAGTCELSGIPFDFDGKKTPNSPSVDRKVAAGPYTKDNCRLVLWSINRALSNLGDEY